MVSVQLKGVRKAFGRVEVVHGVDISIRDGEFVVLVGPSGCGKSTLLRMVAGLEEINSGEIRIGDRVVNNVPPKARDIAMVFQNYALYPHMTVFDNMAFSMKLAGRSRDEMRQRVDVAAKILADRNTSVSRQLGGQRQRVAMGRADRPRSTGIPVRQAAVQPRRQVGADAHRDRRAAFAPQDHVRVRDA
jgi:multiple sugar transport system ATP-binding protein